VVAPPKELEGLVDFEPRPRCKHFFFIGDEVRKEPRTGTWVVESRWLRGNLSMSYSEAMIRGSYWLVSECWRDGAVESSVTRVIKPRGPIVVKVSRYSETVITKKPVRELAIYYPDPVEECVWELELSE